MGDVHSFRAWLAETFPGYKKELQELKKVEDRIKQEARDIEGLPPDYEEKP